MSIALALLAALGVAAACAALVWLLFAYLTLD